MTMVAKSATPSPIDAMSRYFQAASVALSVSSMATSNADTTVVTSIATHNSANPLTRGAIAMDQAKRFNPAKNRRL